MWPPTTKAHYGSKNYTTASTLSLKMILHHLIQEVIKNYEKRNISMLEFLDFYDSYKTNTLQLNNLQLNRVISLEQLNYATGTPFFNQQ